MAPYKLTPEDWPTAMLRLRDRHKSIMVYGLLRSLMKRKWDNFELWTDCWPEFKCIIAKPLPGAGQDPYTGSYYFVDGDDISSMTSLLDEPKIITWQEDMCLCASQAVWPLVQQKGRERGCIEHLAEAPINIVSRDSLVAVDPPEGITVETIGKDMADHVSKTWAHAVPGVDEYMVKILDRQFPTVCFRDSKGNVSAYVVTQFHNLLGMLYVFPEFRRRGLGSAAMSTLCRRQLEEEEFVGALVQDTNPISIHMHRKLGFKPVPDSLQHWASFTANKSS